MRIRINYNKSTVLERSVAGENDEDIFFSIYPVHSEAFIPLRQEEAPLCVL